MFVFVCFFLLIVLRCIVWLLDVFVAVLVALRVWLVWRCRNAVVRMGTCMCWWCGLRLTCGVFYLFLFVCWLLILVVLVVVSFRCFWLVENVNFVVLFGLVFIVGLVYFVSICLCFGCCLFGFVCGWSLFSSV